MAFTKDSKLGFIGAGRVGKALALALHQQGYTVASAASRTFASAEALAKLVPGCTAYPTVDEAAEAADFVFITSTDDSIGLVASGTSWWPRVHRGGPARGWFTAPAQLLSTPWRALRDRVPRSVRSIRSRRSPRWRTR